MNFPLYIARRYLFSKKKHNAINIISAISTCGVALATMALVCTLSVFNGFQDLVSSLFTHFDPPLKVTAARGGTFAPDDPALSGLSAMPEIEALSYSLEEKAMVQYADHQAMATIKGVDDAFGYLVDLDSILVGNLSFALTDGSRDLCIPGILLLSELGTGIGRGDTLRVYAPKSGMRINVANPLTAFNRDYLFTNGNAFMVKQEKYDSHYILTSLRFARQLFGYGNRVSSIELRLHEGANAKKVQRKISRMVGSGYLVQDRYQQQSDVFRIMKVEKLVSYIFLTFILIIACFNIIGSLSMLMADKRDDIQTLRNMGADNRTITRIFLMEGRLITLIGAIAGIVLGVFLCWLQKRFGLIKMGGGGDFIVDYFPVSVHLSDLILIFLTVVAVGFLAVWFPIRYLKKLRFRVES